MLYLNLVERSGDGGATDKSTQATSMHGVNFGSEMRGLRCWRKEAGVHFEIPRFHGSRPRSPSRGVPSPSPPR
ncbi:uncharacterized protein CIMG_13110 [Coccidioides immitis RS]|uniref:Uncharacterized protein n=1 Tax=Coccidioides immitis (strain RS) TaxID=246410 RepID=A0A0D8JWL1_COCIM|nr:uncharacterized protein CIMG_13110 [Coccidioides immitis RS]KJF60663.1 hypothetical protein CIMG_13110 [Coccidioides immitis RS]